MNREQKRKYIKELKSKGFTKEQIDAILLYKKYADVNNYIPEGTKVKLNYNEIKNQPDYPKLTEKFRNWIEDNKDKVYTVEYKKNKRGKPLFVTLKEDTSDPKWLFWVGDLIVVENK